MKLRELRYKKTVMVLVAIAVAWLDLYFLDQWKWYNTIHLIRPNDREWDELLRITFGSIGAEIILWYPEIIILTITSVLLGKNMQERIMLVIIGFVIVYFALFAGLVFLMGSCTSH